MPDAPSCAACARLRPELAPPVRVLGTCLAEWAELLRCDGCGAFFQDLPAERRPVARIAEEDARARFPVRLFDEAPPTQGAVEVEVADAQLACGGCGHRYPVVVLTGDEGLELVRGSDLGGGVALAPLPGSPLLRRAEDAVLRREVDEVLRSASSRSRTRLEVVLDVADRAPDGGAWRRTPSRCPRCDGWLVERAVSASERRALPLVTASAFDALPHEEQERRLEEAVAGQVRAREARGRRQDEEAARGRERRARRAAATEPPPVAPEPAPPTAGSWPARLLGLVRRRAS